MQHIIETCQAFKREEEYILADAVCCPGYHYGLAGHDFWLNRNGHSAGYWSRYALEEMGIGVRLARAAMAFGEAEIYVGDNGKLYVNESGRVWTFQNGRLVKVVFP